jgi:hypothetical protein
MAKYDKTIGRGKWERKVRNLIEDKAGYATFKMVYWTRTQRDYDYVMGLHKKEIKRLEKEGDRHLLEYINARNHQERYIRAIRNEGLVVVEN